MVTGLQIALVLRENPGLSARELGAHLDRDKADINRALYSRRDWFVRIGDTPPRWWNTHDVEILLQRALDSDGEEQGVESAWLPTDDAVGFKLYKWQRRALDAWQRHNGRGIVEAVTGSGKTVLGLAAIADHIRRGGRAAVIVPTIELLRQWVENLNKHLPDVVVGQLGGGNRDDLAGCDVLVAVSNSASQYPLGLPRHQSGLLVADECHRYAAPQLRHALEDEFEFRLGLSATYERSDGAHEEVLLPYFEKVVYILAYAEAIADEVIAHFKVALIPVAFEPWERRDYDQLSERLKKAKSRLVLEFGAVEEPFGEFMAFVNKLSKSGSRQEGIAASRYLSAFAARRSLLAETQAKLEGLRALGPGFKAADRSIIFTHTIDSAEDAAGALSGVGLAVKPIHSGLKPEERRAVLALFADGRLNAIVAPRVLDEGIDVQAADLAVIIAASHQRRQMIQRMGRILRRKADGRVARFAVLFVENTGEDPSHGAHEAFLDEMLEVADDVRRFRLGESSAALAKYLAPS